MPEVEVKRPLWQNVLFFASMVAMLVFANWSKPAERDSGLWATMSGGKWPIAGSRPGWGPALGLWFGLGGGNWRGGCTGGHFELRLPP